jgi:pilus assembly protein CpaC
MAFVFSRCLLLALVLATSGPVLAARGQAAGQQQQPPPPPPTAPPPPGTAAQQVALPEPGAQVQLPVADTPRATAQIRLSPGESTVLTTAFDVVTFNIPNPDIADALVVRPREVVIDGKTPGRVSLILWGRGDERTHYDVVVERGISLLQQQLSAIFPGEDITARQTDASVVLTGQVSNHEVMLRAGDIAQASHPGAKLINMLQLPGGLRSQQVILQVRIAEVRRSALKELGSSIFTGPTGIGDYIFRGTTQQFSAPQFSDLGRTEVGGEVTDLTGEITFSDFLNLFLFNTDLNAGILIRALEQRGWIQSLAEPNLVAFNGQEASFLAGGEIPIPVVQGTTGAVSIQYQEYGVRLNFLPTIAGEMIRLRVRPEVSNLDFANGVTLSGFRVPALQTRWAQTDVELRDGQSYAIAGLLDNIAQEDVSEVPFLSKIPVIGYFFKGKAARSGRTELMVLITPRLVRPLDPDQVPPLPIIPGVFLGPLGIGKEVKGGGGLIDPPQTPARPPATRGGGGR